MDTISAKRIKRFIEARSKGFSTWSLNELIEYIVTNCHQPAKRDIAIIYDVAQVVAYRHGDRHPQLWKLNEALFLSFDNLLHHLKMEETAFFPIIGQDPEKGKHPDLIGKSVSEYIYELAETIPKDHDAFVNDLDAFRNMTRYYRIPDDADYLYKFLLEKMKRFDQVLSFHIHLENSIILPKAIMLAKELNRQGNKVYPFWKGNPARSRMQDDLLITS